MGISGKIPGYNSGILCAVKACKASVLHWFVVGLCSAGYGIGGIVDAVNECVQWCAIEGV